MARNNLGILLVLQGKIPEASRHAQFRQAIELNPDYTDAEYNWGNVLASQGKITEAIVHYQKAVEINPDYTSVRYNLGVALNLCGRLDEAVTQFRTVIKIKPGHANAHGNLANTLAAQDKFDEAVQEYKLTLRLLPNSAQAHFRYGQTLQAQRNFAAAIMEYKKAIDLNLKDSPVYINLAWLLATCPETSLRNGQKAVALAEQARVLAGIESPQLLDALAAAYAEAGRYDDAVETARRALALNATKNNQPLAEAIQSRLNLYVTNTPYHEKP